MCIFILGIPVTPVESAIETKPSLLFPHVITTTARFPQKHPILVTSGTESTRTPMTTEITMKANTTSAGMNMSAQSTTDFYSLEASNAATYSTFSLSSTVEPSGVPHSTASPSVLSKLISSTDFLTAFQTSAVTSHTVSSTPSITSPIPIATSTTLLSASPLPTGSTLLIPSSLGVVPLPLEASTTQLGTAPSTSTNLISKPFSVTSELPAGTMRSRSPSVSHSKGTGISSEVSLPALLAGRATFTRPLFLLGSRLTLSTPTSPVSTLSVRTMSGFGQPVVHSTPISALTSAAPQIPKTTRFETSFPQLISSSSSETTKPLSKPSLVPLNTSSLARFSPKPFLSSVEISVTVSKQTSPLMKGSISTAVPIVARSSPQVASQIPIKTSSSPSVTHIVSIPVHSLTTSLKPKAMRDVTVVSKSIYKEPSTFSVSLLANPTISDTFLASSASTEDKYIIPTDSYSLSFISKKPKKTISSTVFPIRTLVLPPNATLTTTEKITEYLISPRTEMKTMPVAQSAGTFFPKDLSFTIPSSLLRILSTSQPSSVTSHTTSFSVIPIFSRTSSLTRNITATQTPVSSLDAQGASKSPVTDFATSTDFSTFILNISSCTSLSAALNTSIIMPSLLMPKTPKVILESQSGRVSMSSPPPKTTHISTVSLGKQSSSISSSAEDETISVMSAGIITQSTAPMIMNTTVNATSLKTPYTFVKIPPSSSASLLIASDTTAFPRITSKTSDSFVADLKFHMASPSAPTTIETPMYISRKSLFTSPASHVSQSSKETPKMTVMKTTVTTNPLSQTKSISFTASEFKYATSFERTSDTLESNQTSHLQRNVTKTKSTTTEKSSLPYLTVPAGQSSPFSRERNITLAKNLSEVPDVTTSDWSKILTQRTGKAYFNLTEPTELENRTVIDLSHSVG